MEVIPRYTLFTLFTLLTWFTLMTPLIWRTLLKWFTLLTLLILLTVFTLFLPFKLLYTTKAADLEFVKCFTQVRFPTFLILPDKNEKIVIFLANNLQISHLF